MHQKIIKDYYSKINMVKQRLIWLSQRFQCINIFSASGDRLFIEVDDGRFP